MKGGNMSTGDFTVIGYSCDSSMTAFVNGNASILEGGTMFEESTSDYVCVISEELAIYNDLTVGKETVKMSILSLQNISFAYDKMPVLKDISYEFEKGKMV